MEPMELAHWRYCVKALPSDIEEAQSSVKAALEYRGTYKMLDPEADLSWLSPLIESAQEIVETYRWLFEEAKYMAELGAIIGDAS